MFQIAAAGAGSNNPSPAHSPSHSTSPSPSRSPSHSGAQQLPPPQQQQQQRPKSTRLLESCCVIKVGLVMGYSEVLITDLWVLLIMSCECLAIKCFVIEHIDVLAFGEKKKETTLVAIILMTKRVLRLHDGDKENERQRERREGGNEWKRETQREREREWEREAGRQAERQIKRQFCIIYNNRITDLSNV